MSRQHIEPISDAELEEVLADVESFDQQDSAEIAALNEWMDKHLEFEVDHD